MGLIEYTSYIAESNFFPYLSDI